MCELKPILENDQKSEIKMWKDVTVLRNSSETNEPSETWTTSNVNKIHQ